MLVSCSTIIRKTYTNYKKVRTQTKYSENLQYPNHKAAQKKLSWENCMFKKNEIFLLSFTLRKICKSTGFH